MKDIINNGTNIKMRNLAGCVNDKNWTLEDCENKCSKYYSCYAVTEANDILKEYENNKKGGDVNDHVNKNR